MACLELAGLTVEDLLQNVSPAGQTEDESQPSVDGTRFAEVTGEKHEHGSDQKSPEDTSGSRADGLEDEVELNHLERDGDGPVNVTVDDRGGEISDPEFTHVEIVDSCDEGDEGTDGQRCSPMTSETLSFEHEEKCGSNHGNGDDPERDTNGIVSANPLLFSFVVDETSS